MIFMAKEVGRYTVRPMDSVMGDGMSFTGSGLVEAEDLVAFAND